MSLIERAIAYLQPKPEESQIALLSDCVAANTVEALRAVQMLYEDMYGGATFNWYEKAPPAYTLIRWGDVGLRALVESSINHPASKNQSQTIQILSTLAAREKLPRLQEEIRDENLARLVLDSVEDWDNLFDTAQKLLHSYILSFEDDDDITLSVGLQIMTSSLRGGIGPTKEVFAALASRWIALSKPVLSEYEYLLQNYPSDEPRFQSLFERHPQLIDPMALQVWPQPNLHGSRYPDFVVRRKDDTYLVVEIECPSKMLVTSAGQLSADANHAAMQAIDYATFLIERYTETRHHFKNFQNPDCLVVIGMESNLTPELRRSLCLENQYRRNVRIVGFDWILQRAEAVANNVVSHQPEIVRLRMV